jgi:hypothetical protein
MFLIRHRSRLLRLVIGIEANLPYSVVRQKSDTTLLQLDAQQRSAQVITLHTTLIPCIASHPIRDQQAALMISPAIHVNAHHQSFSWLGRSDFMGCLNLSDSDKCNLLGVCDIPA